MYKTRCGKEFERVCQLGAHSSQCKKCKVLKKPIIKHPCIECGTLTFNKKCCSHSCSAKRAKLNPNVKKALLQGIITQARKGKKWEDFFKNAKSSKEKLKKSLKGRKLSNEHCNNISKAMTGRKITWGDKISKTIGKNISLGKYNNSISKTEIEFFNLLENKFNCKIDRQFILENFAFDGKYKNYLIELDGVYWHSIPRRKRLDNYKNIIAKRNNYHLIRIPINNLGSLNFDFQNALPKFSEVFSETN